MSLLLSILPPSALQECDHSNNERLEGAEIEEFLRRLLKRPELEEIFSRYSGEDRVLSAPELLEFLEDQGEDGATLARAQQLIQTYELNETGGFGEHSPDSAPDSSGFPATWALPSPPSYLDPPRLRLHICMLAL